MTTSRKMQSKQLKDLSIPSLWHLNCLLHLIELDLLSGFYWSQIFLLPIILLTNTQQVAAHVKHFKNNFNKQD